MGAWHGGTLIDDWLYEEQGFYGGYRFGWDRDDFWGYEVRFSFGNMRLADGWQAVAAQEAWDSARGFGPNHPFRHRFDGPRDILVLLWDVDVLWYPWGDTPLRPYVMVGLGVAKVDFMDRLSRKYDDVVFALPVAVGLKYRVRPWLALRVELADNMAFPEEVEVMHHLSLTGGLEVRFGGTRKAYWPWNPGRHYW